MAKFFSTDDPDPSALQQQESRCLQFIKNNPKTSLNKWSEAVPRYDNSGVTYNLDGYILSFYHGSKLPIKFVNKSVLAFAPRKTADWGIIKNELGVIINNLIDRLYLEVKSHNNVVAKLESEIKLNKAPEDDEFKIVYVKELFFALSETANNPSKKSMGKIYKALNELEVPCSDNDPIILRIIELLQDQNKGDIRKLLDEKINELSRYRAENKEMKALQKTREDNWNRQHSANRAKMSETISHMKEMKAELNSLTHKHEELIDKLEVTDASNGILTTKNNQLLETVNMLSLKDNLSQGYMTDVSLEGLEKLRMEALSLVNFFETILESGTKDKETTRLIEDMTGKLVKALLIYESGIGKLDNDIKNLSLNGKKANFVDLSSRIFMKIRDNSLVSDDFLEMLGTDKKTTEYGRYLMLEENESYMPDDFLKMNTLQKISVSQLLNDHVLFASVMIKHNVRQIRSPNTIKQARRQIENNNSNSNVNNISMLSLILGTLKTFESNMKEVNLINKHRDLDFTMT